MGRSRGQTPRARWGVVSSCLRPADCERWEHHGAATADSLAELVPRLPGIAAAQRKAIKWREPTTCARRMGLTQWVGGSPCAEFGAEAITIKDICDVADVGRSTFYAHYTGKDDLKRSGLEQLRRQLMERQKQALAAPTVKPSSSSTRGPKGSSPASCALSRWMPTG